MRKEGIERNSRGRREKECKERKKRVEKRKGAIVKGRNEEKKGGKEGNNKENAVGDK